MKDSLTHDEISKMKAGLFLMWQGVRLLDDSRINLDERTDYTADTFDFNKILEEIKNKTFDLGQEYLPKEDFFKNPLKANIVHMLSQSLPEMVEIDEVNMTLEAITKVIDWKLTPKDKEHLNNILNEIKDRNYNEKMEKFIFTKEFLNSSYFK